MKRARRFFVCLVAAVSVGVCAASADELSSSERLTRPREEVLALIEEAGTSKPTWWDLVALEYPETLDLSYPHPPPTKEWSPRLNVGQFMWSIINENASRFRQGTKFMHFVLKQNIKQNTDKPQVVRRCKEQLAHCYHDLLQDWARAAYWKRQLRARDVTLANCYWQLGSKEMAVEILDRIRFDPSRYGGVIKQWADIGELEKALALAKGSVRSNNWGAAYRAAGDAYRKFGRYAEAVEYYENVLAVKSKKKDNLILKHNHREHWSVREL
jgi:tetratricopeptide (TPR) repeat protein